MRPLLLLPGLDGTGTLFRAFAAALPPEIEPRALSYPPDRVLSLDEYAVLVEQRVPRDGAFLLAESFSGLVALALLARSRVPVHGVIFCAAFARPPRPLLLRLAPMIPLSGALMRITPAFLLRGLCIGRGAAREDLALLRNAVASVSPRVLASRLRLIGEAHDFGRERLAVPCAYLQATADRLVPPGSARDFAERFESFTVERIEGPHFLLQARPRECADAVSRHLRAMGAST